MILATSQRASFFIAAQVLTLLTSFSQAQTAFLCTNIPIDCTNLDFLAPGLCSSVDRPCDNWQPDAEGISCCIYTSAQVYSNEGTVNSSVALCTLTNQTLIEKFSASGPTSLELMIDDFISPMTVSVDALAPAAAGAFVDSVGVLGVERDLYVEKTAGTVGERIRVRVNPLGENKLRQTIDDANGFAVLTYDGPDGLFEPSQVNYTGLGSLDFSIYTNLELAVSFSDNGGPVIFKFWDASDPTGNTFATTTINVGAGIPAGSHVTYTRSLLSFTPTGSTIANIMDSVGAIQITIDATAVAQQGWDTRFEYFRLTGTKSAC